MDCRNCEDSQYYIQVTDNDVDDMDLSWSPDSSLLAFIRGVETILDPDDGEHISTGTDIYILDPILSIMISLYVLYNVLRNLRKTLALFLQAVPDAIDLAEVEKALEQITQVISVHHTHVWSLDGENHVLTTHLVVDSTASKEDLTRIKCEFRAITSGMSLAHSTVELEFEDDCSMNNNHKR